MNLPSFELPPLAALALAAAGVVAALRVLLATRRASTADALVAVGWGPRRIQLLSAAMSFAASVAVLWWQLPADVDLREVPAHAAATQSAPAQLAPALAWALVVLLVMPALIERTLRAMAVARYERRRDDALLGWLRRIRLFVAAGRPISAAVLDAAERTTEPAFRPTAGTVNHAVTSGRDPLSAVAQRLGGTSAATLLGSVEAAERSGAGASDLLDGVLARVVGAMVDARRERIDSLASLLGIAASASAVLAGAVVVIAVVVTLPST